MKVENKTIVITGGASGIGLAIITELAINNTIISLDRNEEKIRKLKEAFPKVYSIKTDVSLSGELKSAISEIDGKFKTIDILINNAGIGYALDFTNSVDVLSLAQKEMAVNYFAPIELTKLALPLLERSKEPTIVFTTSGLAYMPTASHPTYAATKSALHSFVLSLRHQLRKTNIKVVELLPPTVDTAFTKDIDAPKITSEKVAKDLLKGLQKDRTIIEVGQVKALGIISRVTPTGAFKMLNPSK